MIKVVLILLVGVAFEDARPRKDGTMTSLMLPRLAGGRERAVQLASGLPATDLSDTNIQLDCRLLSAPPSFADELVKQLLADRNVKILRVDASC
jgi:hypothetical protein